MITKSKSLGQLIKEADEVFSEYIRVRDAKPFSGLVHCYICGVAIPWRQAHAMHFIDRDQMPVRYHQANVHGGCQVCNMMDDKHKEKYRDVMIKDYGMHEVQALENRAKGLQKYVRPDLVEMIGFYKGASDHLRKQKHI